LRLPYPKPFAEKIFSNIEKKTLYLKLTPGFKMQLLKTEYTYQIKEIIMKNRYKTQIITIKRYIKNILGKILETYNNTMFFK